MSSLDPHGRPSHAAIEASRRGARARAGASRDPNARASKSQTHAARVRAELRTHGVERLEDRPCRFCSKPIGSARLRDFTCGAEQCQYQRVREMNRGSCRRYYAKSRECFQPDPRRWMEKCARDACQWSGFTTNRALCPKCSKDPDRHT